MNRKYLHLPLALSYLLALAPLARGADTVPPPSDPEGTSLQDSVGTAPQVPRPGADRPLPGARERAAAQQQERFSKESMLRLEWTALAVLMLLFIVAVYQLRAQFDDDGDEE